jgi:hypothetical protein
MKSLLALVVIGVVASGLIGPAAGAYVPPPIIDLTVGVVAESLPPLDPALVDLPDTITPIENLFLGLTNYDPLTSQVVPELATSWSTSDDGLTWTFNLRQDVSWMQYDPATDEATTQRPVTAQDVVYGFQRASDPRFGAANGCPGAVADVQAPDDATLDVRLQQPDPAVVDFSRLSCLYPVPREPIEQSGDAWTQPGTIWTNGPYLLDSTTADTLTLTKNQAFPGANLIPIDAINWVIVDAFDAALARFKNGTLDAVYDPTAARWVFQPYVIPGVGMDFSTWGVHKSSASAPVVDISDVTVTWGGYPVSHAGFGTFDPDTPWAAYGDYVQYGAGTLLPGTPFGWDNSFSGTGEVFFPYGTPDGNQYLYLDGTSWTADFISDPQDVRVRFGAGGGQAAIRKDEFFKVTIDLSEIAGDEFYYSGTYATFAYDAATDTADIYLISGTLEYGGETYTGPDDGATALHLTAQGGAISSVSVPLADALAAIPAKLRSLTVQITLAQPVAHPGISAAFDLDGDPATGLGADAGALYVGLGADLIVSAQPDASGELSGQAQIVQADGTLSDPFPVAVVLDVSQQAIQLQTDLDTLRRQAAQVGVGIQSSSGMRWRVAASDADQPNASPALFPGIPVARANFSVSYTTTSGSLVVTFADKSTPVDPNNPITGWLWDFGDNTSSTEMNPAHTYAGGGDYQVTLTLTFADGNTDSMTVPLKLEGPPPPEPPPSDVCTASTTQAANLRDGPGTDYALVGSVPADSALYVTGVNATGDWYAVRTERFPSGWIAGFLITPPQCPAGFALPVRG